MGKFIRDFLEYIKYREAKKAEANGDKEYFINCYADKKWWKEVLKNMDGYTVKARLSDGTTLWILPPDSHSSSKVNWEL